MEHIHALEDKISTAITRASAGEFDGDEFGDELCKLYIYGPSAERLSALVIPVLKEYHPPHGSYLIKRFGKPGAQEERIELGSGQSTPPLGSGKG